MPVTLVAVLAYLPLLLTHPGQVAADTRQAIYVDPGRWLARALSLWDDSAHLGTVTHQNTGLVFPMGVWFWLTERLGLPVWLAQRLWVGTILFAAGAGVLYLARTWRWRGLGPLVAAAGYLLSPYALQYVARTSVLLLPWAGLPWLVAFAALALRHRGWRYPALFALTVLAVGGGNATAILLAGLGPALSVPFAVWGTREAPVRQAVAGCGRMLLLTALTSTWAVVVLRQQGRYGLDVLAYTESLQSVSTTSLATEILRGLGYWVFYGQEARAPNVASAVAYLQNPGLLVLSFAIPGLALLAAVLVRFRQRAYALTLVVVGLVVAVGAYPFADPSPLGNLFQEFAARSNLGLALRSSNRAAPLVALGLFVCLGMGVTALAARLPRTGLVVAIAAVGLLVSNQPALFTGLRVDPNYRRPEALPEWWQEATAALDGGDPVGRVLEVPGQQFAAYRWGTTYEPVTPGLLARGSVTREQLPYGSAPSADLVAAFDRRLQEGVFEPASIAPVARRIGAGDVLLRSDLAFERYLTPRPRALWQQLQPTPPGLGDAVSYGPAAPNQPVPRLPLVDSRTLGVRPDAPDPAEVVTYPVIGSAGPAGVRPARGPVVLAGDAEGIVGASAAGRLTGGETVLYAAALDAAQLDQALADGGELVLTDSNRRRTRRWRATRDTTGATLRADEPVPVDDEGDVPLEVFPGTSTAEQTVIEHRGATVTASTYGGPFFVLDPFARPAAALDGDPRTAWAVGPALPGEGQWLSIQPDQPVTADRVTLLQRQTGVNTTRITRVRLSFDTGDPIDVDLGPSSLTGPGQDVVFPARTFDHLRVTILATATEPAALSFPTSPMGFAEVTVPGMTFAEVVRLPTGLLDRVGAASADHALTVQLERLRSDPADPSRQDEEQAMVRSFTLPTARTFTLTGTGRLSAATPDEAVDALLGPRDGGTVVRASSSSRLAGDLDSRAASVLDGDPATAWQPAFFDLAGAWFEVELEQPAEVTGFELDVVADGRHSVPTAIAVEVDGVHHDVTLPAVDDRAEPGATVTLPVTIPATTGRTVRVTTTGVRPVTSTEYFTGAPEPLPLGVAELRLAGATLGPLPPALDGRCRDDLLTIDGAAVPVRLVGATADAVDRRGLSVEQCGPPVTLVAGDHLVRTGNGVATGIDLDRLVLESTVPPTAPPAPQPAVEVERRSPSRMRVTVSGATAPYWLVNGQSFNEGWRARDAGGVDLGEAVLVDGYTNGWRVDPAGGATQVFDIEWVPQRAVSVGLLVSLAGAVACVVLALWRPRYAALPGVAPAPEPALADRPLWPSPRTSALTIGGWALAGGLLVAWWAAPVTGLAAAAGRWRRGTRLVALAGGLALVGGAFAWVAVSQVLDPRRPDYEWVNPLASCHRAALLGVLVLAAVLLPGTPRADR